MPQLTRSRRGSLTVQVTPDESQRQVLWAFGFAGLGTSCGASEATPTFRAGVNAYQGRLRQRVATQGNGFRVSEPFSAPSHLRPGRSLSYPSSPRLSVLATPSRGASARMAGAMVSRDGLRAAAPLSGAGASVALRACDRSPSVLRRSVNGKDRADREHPGGEHEEAEERDGQQRGRR